MSRRKTSFKIGLKGRVASHAFTVAVGGHGSSPITFVCHALERGCLSPATQGATTTGPDFSEWTVEIGYTQCDNFAVSKYPTTAAVGRDFATVGVVESGAEDVDM